MRDHAGVATDPRTGDTGDIDLSVRLLGRVEIDVGGRSVRLSGRQAQALAALLVLVRRVRSRDVIAAELWPEATSATGSLRQALWLLRSSFASAGVDPDHVLESDADALGLRPDLRLDVDVDRFDAAIGARPCEAEAAVAAYQGELAECLGHECFARERERLADAYEDALVVVAEQRLAACNLGGARAAALRLVARDPLREEAHAVLIRVYGAEGSRSQVQRQFRRLRELLRRDLDVDPLPETSATFRQAIREAESRSADVVMHRRLTEPSLVVVGSARTTDTTVAAVS